MMNNKFVKSSINLIPAVLLTQVAYASGTESAGGTLATAHVLYMICALLAAAVLLLSVKLARTNARLTDSKALEAINITPDEKLLLEKIHEGFDNEEFKMYLQFTVDSKTKHIVAAEALSRWETTDGEIVFPGKYIGLMEKSGLIISLDYYMLDAACKKLSVWKDTDLCDITISCNFTRITISEKDFVDKIKAIADKYEFDRSKLIIEITEDSIEKNLDVAMANILKAKELGFRIALDDIGRGYTSLINLCEYPIDIVKLDRDILLSTDRPKGKELFHGIVSLAQTLNLKVVCEGVETEAQNDLVCNSACDFIQGWYYSKAMAEPQAENFAREYARNLSNGEQN